MITSSNGNIFRVTGHLCGEFTGPRWFPRTKASDVFFDLRLNKRLSKQSWGWWFETPSRPLWHNCNDIQCVGKWRYCSLALSHRFQGPPKSSLIPWSIVYFSNNIAAQEMTVNQALSAWRTLCHRVYRGPNWMYNVAYDLYVILQWCLWWSF